VRIWAPIWRRPWPASKRRAEVGLSLLPEWSALSVFMVAALAVGISPGPGMLYAVARGIGQGSGAAAVSVLGLSTGSFVNCLIAALGMSAVLAASPLAYDIVRYAGAAYLCYLAYRIFTTGSDGIPVGELHADGLGRIYVQGIITNIVNPKSALFYLSFVPQFVDPARGSPFAQFILLGLIFNVGGNVVNLLVALFFGRIGDWLSHHPRVWQYQRWFTASVLAGLALHLVLAARR
jgi:threonine/homoserine/homoserine lactone efflux protein